MKEVSLAGNSLAQVRAAIGATQDGGLKALDKGRDEYNQFINSLIENNTKDGLFVDCESLADDMRYMVDQLQATLRPLDAYNDSRAKLNNTADR